MDTKKTADRPDLVVEVDESRREALKSAAGLAVAAALGSMAVLRKSSAAVATYASTVAPWAAAPGMIVDVALNTLASQALDVPRYQTRVVYDAWCGITYFPWWGRFGTFVQSGGGHGDSAYNDIYAYSVEERRHTRIKGHAPIFEHADRYIADEVTGWMWASTSTNALQVGEPFSPHMYAYSVAIPPGVIAGDAPNGWLFTPGRVSIPYVGQRNTKQSHRFAVGVAEKWEAHGAPLARSPEHACALYDSKRKRVVSVGDNPTRTLVWINTAEESGTLNLDREVMGYYHTAFYDEQSDLYLTIRFLPGNSDNPGAGVKFQVIDPKTNTVTLPALTGAFPTSPYIGGWDWVPEWQALVFYPGRGNDVWTLKAAGSDLKGQYKFEKQTLMGAATQAFSDNPHFNRFRYVPGLACFLWFPSVEHPVQAFGVRPPGAYVPSQAITTFTITSEVLGTDVPFTIGQAFKKGEVADSVRIEGITSQCNVLNRWEDGSIKFAALTGVATFGEPVEFELRKAPAPAPVTPAPFPTRSMSVQAAGQTIDLSSAERRQVRFSGSEMTEYSASKRINEHMIAFFNVRVYRTGDVWVRWTVHNGYLRVPGARNFAYRLKVTAEGRSMVDQQVDHKSRARITGTCWLGRSCNITLEHDLAYLAGTKLVPNYGWRAPASSAFSFIAQASTPMGRGNLRAGFSDTGYDDQIGLLPRWDALYLTSGDPRAYRGVIANAESGGSYSIHQLDEATLRPPKFSDHPDLWLQDGSMAFSGGTAYGHDQAHQPSIGYLAYLLTADQFFAEEVQHWATYNHFYTTPANRERRNGIMKTQPRGVAWSWRTLATAAVVTPDSDPLRPEYAFAWASNMTRYHDWFVTGIQPAWLGGPNNLGAMGLYSGGADGSAYHPGNAIWEDAPWMQHFIQSALGFSADLEVPLQTAAQRNIHIALRNFSYKHVIGMLGVPGSGRPYQRGAAYEIPYGTTATANELKSPIVHYPSWTAQWTANKAWSTNPAWSSEVLTDPVGNALLGNVAEMSSSYWGNLHPAIALAVDAGVPGAAAAYARMTNATNYAAGAASFHNMPQFGIVPRS